MWRQANFSSGESRTSFSFVQEIVKITFNEGNFVLRKLPVEKECAFMLGCQVMDCSGHRVMSYIREISNHDSIFPKVASVNFLSQILLHLGPNLVTETMPIREVGVQFDLERYNPREQAPCEITFSSEGEWPRGPVLVGKLVIVQMFGAAYRVWAKPMGSGVFVE